MKKAKQNEKDDKKIAIEEDSFHKIDERYIKEE